MKSSTISLVLFLISASSPLFAASNNGDTRSKLEENKEPHVKRSDFPPGFLFGAATSAYQVEGAYLEDAKSLSNWDAFYQSTGYSNGENGDIADDHYHQFLGDIDAMHSLGLDSYRFSISWTRILPRGRFGKVNPAGIIFYNKIIDNLILKGIKPFVTLNHNDFPQELEDKYGSWLSPEMQEDFLYLAEVCFKSFGDRVKYWVTINEPNMFVELAYELGMFPPFRCSEPFGNCLHGNSDVEPLIAMHNMLLAHGRAAKLYHENFQPKQGGLIGLVVHCFMYEPLSDSELDREAAKRAFAFDMGWPLDPVVFGDYPEEMHKYLGSKLPSFSLEEKKFMKNSIDFIGINHYSTLYSKDCTNSSCSTVGNSSIQGFVEKVVERDGVLIGEPTGLDYLFVVPRGMEEIVNLIKLRYNNKPMFITENGYSSPDLKEQRVSKLLNDVKRVEFHESYLASLAKSMRDGADVRGYFVWSLMDSYEWLEGYNVRFGLYYVDRQTLTRVPKLSARWYKKFLTNNSVLIDQNASRKERLFGKDRDIELMHLLGLKAYRFSISWARILPRGRFGEVNPAGIMFYNKIIDNLILKGFELFVTLHHIEFPQEFEDRYGSWLNPEMQEEFLYFTETCFKFFGDRVKYWITINEPRFFVDIAYGMGIAPPGRCSEPFGTCLDGNSDMEPIIAMHNILLAHGRAAKLYHENFQPKQHGSIGLIEHCYMYEPLTDSELDREASKRAFAFNIGWSLDPSIFGEYPEEVKEYLGSDLPTFSPDEKKFMKNSIDFIGINHYSSIYAKDCTNSSCSATGNRAIRGFVETVGERDGVLIGDLTAVEGSYVVPRGMEEIVNLIKIRYNNTPMFITENGYSSPDVHEQRVDELVNDVKRVEYHTAYLTSLVKSMRGGADVRGYFVWALMDGYEWLQGYKVRYGLHYVDRQTLTRMPKLSARWYKNFLTNNTEITDAKV
ncbi:hypothetical protein SSX86_005844 [Deinandra increscens subsp. villosa]|uniref:Beta-glucosidase n=1 Tax=Deinandra increscens subsp. villosa TaxID=3103831 RepID=A0AAP0DRS1_9ASTR